MKLHNLTLLLILVFAVNAAYTQVPYPGNDAEWGVTRISGLVDPYTGNLAFSTRDLVVAGAVGRRGLSWIRFTTSRTSQKENLFGLGHNWAHSWQWEMVDEGRDGQGREVISIRLPGGWVHRLTQTSPGQWWPEPGTKQRAISDGDSFIVLQNDHRGGEVRFTRSQTKDGAVFRLREIVDAMGNVSKLTWEQNRLVQVTEPAGRWLKISYASLSAPDAVPGVKAFVVIDRVLASDGQSVIYHYRFPAGADYPVLTAADYPDGARASYIYTTESVGGRALLAKVIDPRADASVQGRSFRYYNAPGAAAGQIREVRTADARAVLQAITPDDRGLRSYTVQQENGSKVHRSYHPGGNLAEEIDALGYTKQYLFDANNRGFKIASVDGLGKTTYYGNDSNGQSVKSIAPDGSTLLWQRDSRGLVVSESNELGFTRTFLRDEKGRIVKVLYPDGSGEEITYNDFGQVTSQKDRSGAVTTTTYDDRGLRTKITHPLGYWTSWRYDRQDRLIETTDSRGNTTRYERDQAGRVTKTLYADGASTATLYDSFGRVIESVDAAGAMRKNTYDEFGRLISTTDALGHVTRRVYADLVTLGAPFHLPVQTISPVGRVSAVAYDANGNVSARTSAAGTKQAATTRFAYDPAGRQIAMTDPRGKTVQFFYDDRGRRIKVMNALNYVTTTVYDPAGHKIKETDPKGNITSWSYNALGQELTKTDAENQTTRRAYDARGFLAALTDAKGDTYHFEYDAMGRQTALIFPDGSRETTTYEGALKTRFTNRAGLTRTFGYDSRNREIASAWSDGSEKITKAYDDAGRLILEDNEVSRITYQFDAVGRLASETQDLSRLATAGTSDPAPRTISYTYTEDNERESITYPDQSFVKYAYDARGQLQAILGDGVPPPIASYEYDAAGNAIQMPRENETATEIAYDSVNRPLEIVEHGSRRSPLSELEYAYDPAGNRTSTTTTAYGVTKQGFSIGGEVTRNDYFYDDTYQLTGVDQGRRVEGDAVGQPESQTRFTYDAVGNRVEVNNDGAVTRYSTNNLNQYIRVGEFSPTYDANGNLAAMGQWLYRYDAGNRLVSATNGTTTASFYYDSKNRCVARHYTSSSPRTPASITTLNYYDNWSLIAEYAVNGIQTARYVHGRRVDEIVVMVNRHGVFYPHHDVLGNVTMLTDTAGKLIERYAYSVEGKLTITNAKGRELPRSAVDNRWTYTGREYLQEVNLFDYRNRVYSSDTGRFLQTDPIRFQASDINIYRYVSNSYNNYTDPTGLDWFRQDTEQYVAGRAGTIVQEGGLVSQIIEDWVPAGHTFAVNHDAFVGWAVHEMGIPDLFANVPSMPFVYVVSFVQEVIESVGNFFGWLFNLGE